MIIPALEEQHKRWDRYKQFHWGYAWSAKPTDSWSRPPFIVFDDNSVLCTQTAPNPAERGIYTHLGVSLLMTTHPSCPKLKTPDGLKLPKAWLNEGGGQYLLHDHATAQIVALGDPGLGQRYRPDFLLAWIPNPGEPPLGAAVRLSSLWTAKHLAPSEERDHCEGLLHSMRAEFALTDRGTTTKDFGLNQYYQQRSSVAPEEMLKASYWTDLKPEYQWRLFHYGYARKQLTAPYLLVDA